MKTHEYSRRIEIVAPAEVVFAYMDDIRNTGMHMTTSSAPMMGSNLTLSQLSENRFGLDSKYRWHGRIMGLEMDFTVVATRWVAGREKVWETLPGAKMLILDWYQMRLTTEPISSKAAEVLLSIRYRLPRAFHLWLVSVLLAPFYAWWCVSQMLTDAKRNIESGQIQDQQIRGQETKSF